MTTGDPLPTTNQAASFADQTVANVVQSLEKPTEAAIIAAEPVMATPVLMQIWEGMLDFVFKTIGNVLGKLAGYVVIDIQAYVALKNAASALADLRAAQKAGNPDAIIKANATADAAAAASLHYIGSIHP